MKESYDSFFSRCFSSLSWVPSLLTCITLSVSACCILLRMALRIWSRFSPSSLPAFEIKVETSLPTKAAVNSEVRGSRSWLTTCITYQSPLWPCSSCHCAICSSATDTYARRHSPPFYRDKQWVRERAGMGRHPVHHPKTTLNHDENKGKTGGTCKRFPSKFYRLQLIIKYTTLHCSICSNPDN